MLYLVINELYINIYNNFNLNYNVLYIFFILTQEVRFELTHDCSPSCLVDSPLSLLGTPA